jgi:hypothetical protein
MQGAPFGFLFLYSTRRGATPVAEQNGLDPARAWSEQAETLATDRE